MMRPLPLAACLALAALPLAALTAQQETPSAPAPVEAAASAAAPAAAPAPLVGNPDTGRTLTYTCLGCHGIEGYKNAYPSFKVPKIGGQSADYLANALT